jgi:hypothetical protein
MSMKKALIFALIIIAAITLTAMVVLFIVIPIIAPETTTPLQPLPPANVNGTTTQD